MEIWHNGFRHGMFLWQKTASIMEIYKQKKNCDALSYISAITWLIFTYIVFKTKISQQWLNFLSLGMFLWQKTARIMEIYKQKKINTITRFVFTYLVFKQKSVNSEYIFEHWLKFRPTQNFKSFVFFSNYWLLTKISTDKN